MLLSMDLMSLSAGLGDPSPFLAQGLGPGWLSLLCPYPIMNTRATSLVPHTNPHACWIFFGFRDLVVRKYGPPKPEGRE